MEKQALLKRGFVENSWTDEGETFTEYKLLIGDFVILISGISLVEISLREAGCQWLTVPNCKTIKDLDNLIRLFK